MALVPYLLEIERLMVEVYQVVQRAEPRQIDPPRVERGPIRLLPDFEAVVRLHCRSHRMTTSADSSTRPTYTGIGRSEGETASGAPVTAWISSTL